MQNIRLQKQLVAAIFAAVIAVFAQFTIPLPIVPLTLQTFIVGLTATILGRKVGSLAVIIYLVLDATGPFVDSAASCQLYSSFRFLFVPGDFDQEKLAVYDHVHETPLGKVYMKSRSEMLLDEEVRVVVEPVYHALQLRSDSGILANNIEARRINPADYEGKTNTGTSSC